MNYFRIITVALLVIVMTACVPIWQTKPNALSPESLFELRSKALVQLDRWEIEGRTVITQGKEGWNVGLRWQENEGLYQIKLAGPFSQGGATLSGDETTVVLTMNDGKQYSAATPEILITDVMGWDLPISALRDWVRGLPYSGQKIALTEYDEQGRLIHLVQQDWDIEFLRYIPFENYSMPGKIFIKHPELSLRLIIVDWDRP